MSSRTFTSFSVTTTTGGNDDDDDGDNGAVEATETPFEQHGAAGKAAMSFNVNGVEKNAF